MTAPAPASILTAPAAAPAEGAPPPAAAPPASTEAAQPPAADAKPGSEAKPTAAPAALELKLPDGFTADEGLLTGFKGLAGEFGLDSAKAQKLIDLYVGTETARVKAQAEAFQTQVAEWAKAVETDKELGGANLPQTKAFASQAVQRFGGAPLVEFLNNVGLGNHPVLVKTFAAIGRALADDSIAGGVGASPAPQKDPLELLYPTMFQK